MATKNFKTLKDLLSHLSDEEITAQKPCYRVGSRAKVLFFSVPFKIEIREASEWEFSYPESGLNAFRDYIFFKYALLLQKGSDISDGLKEVIEDRLTVLAGDLDDAESIDDMKEKGEVLKPLIHERDVKSKFFKTLKFMGSVPFWLTEKMFYKSITPPELFSIFILTFFFSFTVYKRSIAFLMLKVAQSINRAGVIEFKPYTNSAFSGEIMDAYEAAWGKISKQINSAKSGSSKST